MLVTVSKDTRPMTKGTITESYPFIGEYLTDITTINMASPGEGKPEK